MCWCFFFLKKSLWSFKLYIESQLQSREPFCVWSHSSRGRLYSLEERIFLYSPGCKKVLDSLLKMSTFVGLDWTHLNMLINCRIVTLRREDNIGLCSDAVREEFKLSQFDMIENLCQTAVETERILWTISLPVKSNLFMFDHKEDIVFNNIDPIKTCLSPPSFTRYLYLYISHRALHVWRMPLCKSAWCFKAAVNKNDL